ncbi:uncharacterized protein LOC144064419 isoform X2 [Stigmatopora argus]
MDIVGQGSVRNKTDSESPHPSLKRPWIEYPLTNNNTGTYDLPEVSTSQIFSSPSLTSPRDADPICTGVNGNNEEKRKCNECQLSELPLKDKPPADCSLHFENGITNDVKVRSQSDFSFDSNQLGSVLYAHCQSSAFYESTRTEYGKGFTGTIYQREVNEVNGETSCHIHIKEFQLFFPPPNENIPKILAEDKSNVDVCDIHAVGEWGKDNQANDEGTKEISNIEFKEASTIPYHTTPSIYSATETCNPNDFEWARGDHGDIEAKTQNKGIDNMSENHISMITVESAERDNNAVPCRVIEHAVVSQTVRDAERNCCNLKNAAVEALPPSVIVSELEIPLPPISDVRHLQPALHQTVHSPRQSRPEEYEDEKEELSECSIPSFGKHNTPGDEGTRRLTLSQSKITHKTTKPLPADDGRLHNFGTFGHHLEEQCNPLSVSCDQFKAQQVENSLLGTIMNNELNDIKEIKGEIISDEMVLQEKNPTTKQDKTELPLNGGLREVTKLTPEVEVKYKPCCFFEYQHTEEILECKEEVLAVSFPPFCDAVVPDTHELTPRTSQKPHCAMAKNSKDRFSPLPSAFATYTRFDNFRKIQLSADYDDEDDNQRNQRLHASLTMQQIKFPQKEHFILKAEDGHKDKSKVMEEEQIHDNGVQIECHTDDMANEALKTDINCNKAAPGEDTALELSNNATGNNMPLPEEIQCVEFKMKKEFDLVLKELNVYFDICKNEMACGNGMPTEQCGDVLNNKVSKSKSHLSSEEQTLHRDPTLDPEQEGTIDMCPTEPEDCHVTSHGDEQEVPINCDMSTEASSLFAEKDKEPQQTDLKRTAWSPSFMYQQSHGLCLQEELDEMTAEMKVWISLLMLLHQGPDLV